MKKKNLKAIALTLVTALAITAMPVGTVTAEAASKPAQVKNLKKTAVTSNSITVKFKKVKNIKGYQIRVYNTKNKLVKSKTTKKIKYKITGLKASTKYKIKVRAYKVSNKKKVYGKYSKTITVKTAKSSTKATATPTVKPVTTVKPTTVPTATPVPSGAKQVVPTSTIKPTITNTPVPTDSADNTTPAPTDVVTPTDSAGNTTPAPTDVVTPSEPVDNTTPVIQPGTSTSTGDELKKEYEAWRDAWLAKTYEKTVAKYPDTTPDYERYREVWMITEIQSITTGVRPFLSYSTEYDNMYDLYKYNKGNDKALCEMQMDMLNQIGIKTEVIDMSTARLRYGHKIGKEDNYIYYYTFSNGVTCSIRMSNFCTIDGGDFDEGHTTVFNCPYCGEEIKVWGETDDDEKYKYFSTINNASITEETGLNRLSNCIGLCPSCNKLPGAVENPYYGLAEDYARTTGTYLLEGKAYTQAEWEEIQNSTNE